MTESQRYTVGERTDSDFTTWTAAELAEKIHSREISSTEVTQAHLDRISDVDGEINAFLHVSSDEALAAAHNVDAAIAAGDTPTSSLAGVPVALKDSFVTVDAPTTAASKMLEGYMSPYDSTVALRLRSAGIPILGKTNLDEFAMGSSTENSAYGATKNPWDLERTPGGSGGGSAAALAAGMTPLGIGSDTGGSIRQPAALTNTVGVKPTYGSVSRYGLIACASSLDQGGPAARTVLDAAKLHEVIAGFDQNDATSSHRATPKVVEAAKQGANGDLKGVKVGVLKQYQQADALQEGVAQRHEENLAQLREQGAEIVEIDCPNFDHALSAYYMILFSEVSSNLARFDGMRYGLRAGDDGTRSADEVMALSRAEGFGPEVKRRIMLGTYTLSVGSYDAYYLQAQRVRNLVAQDLAAAFEKVDVIASPTTPSTAFKLGEKVDDPLQMYLFDLFTLPVNMAGVCGISIPAGLTPDTALPTGLQLMGPAHGDDRLYRVGAAFEQGLGA